MPEETNKKNGNIKIIAAKEAQRCYFSKKYADAVDGLRKLTTEIIPEKDHRIQHNMYLADYLKLSSSVPRDLRQKLKSLLLAIVTEETERTEKDNMERQQKQRIVSTNNGTTTSSTGTAKVATQRATTNNLASSSTLMLFNMCISNYLFYSLEYQELAYITYNLAACYFMEQKYSKAYVILDALLINIEPIDDIISMHIGFLYLEVILAGTRSLVCTQNDCETHITKANNIIAFLEKLYQNMIGNENSTENASNTQGGATEQHNSVQLNGKVFTEDSMESVEFKFRLHLYRIRIGLVLNQLKVVKKESKSALELYQKEIKGRDTNVTASNGKNPSSNAKQKTNMMNTIPSYALVFGHLQDLNLQNAAALFLKANFEFIRGNYMKCIKLLASCQKENIASWILFNNFGCLHYYMKKTKASKLFFAKAVDAILSRPKGNQKNSKNSTKSSAIEPLPECEIMYNNGLQLLIDGQYALAFTCFNYASRIFYRHPRLWYRLGECCVAAYNHQEREKFMSSPNQLISNTIGSGRHQRIVLPVKAKISSTCDINSSKKYPSVPQMSLSYAAKCFLNSIALCEKALGLEKLMKKNLIVEFPDDPETQMIGEIWEMAIVNLIYVYLHLREFALANATGQKLLLSSNGKKSSRYLVQQYLAEANCMLSKAHDGAIYMGIVKSKETIYIVEPDLTQLIDEYSKLTKRKMNIEKAGIYVNKAIVHVYQNELQEAENFCSLALLENPDSIEAKRLLTYLTLQKGRTSAAIRYLKLGPNVEKINKQPS